MKLRSNPFLRPAHFVAALALVASPVAHAASQTWGSSTTGNWSDVTKWVGGAAPGATSGLTNTDLATFTNAAGGTITIDSATQNIGSITNNSTVKYTIGSAGVNLGNSLFLSSGGSIATTGGAGITVNAPLVLAPASPTTAGSYTFSHTSGASVMTIAGNVTGGTTTQGINLNLFGTSVTRGNSIVTGAISDGGAAGGLSVTAGDNNFTMWVLSGNNTYTGVTNVNGRLNIRSVNALGSTVGGTVVSNNGNAALELQGASITYAAEALSLSGTGNSGNGALRNISGNNTWTGAITLAGAANIISNANTLTIDVASGNAITATNHNLTLGGAGIGEVKDAIATGSGTLTKVDAGTWTLSGANTYSGATLISGGTLTLTNSLAMQSSALDTAGSITGTGSAGLKTNQTALTIGGITGNKNLASVFTTASGGYTGLTGLTLNPGTGVTNSYSADIGNGNGSMTLTKSGLGTQTLTGTNTYSGATAVNAGKLTVSGNIANTAVTVSGAGTILASDAAANIGTSLAINNGAILAAGDAASAGTITVGGATTFENGSVFSWDINSTGVAYDKMVNSNVVDGGTAGGAVFQIVAADAAFANAFWTTNRTWTDIFTTNGTTAVSNWATAFGSSVSVVNSSFISISPVGGSFTLSGNTLSWTAVPEPTSALAGLLIGAGLLRRRRTA